MITPVGVVTDVVVSARPVETAAANDCGVEVGVTVELGPEALVTGPLDMLDSSDSFTFLISLVLPSLGELAGLLT